MVELKRGTQIAVLKAKGWTQDRECQLLQHGTRDHMGGPTFMRASCPAVTW